MANVSGKNIDDLFRQASDKYPLRTDSADWGRLSDALDKEASLAQPLGREDERHGSRRLVWLLLLLLPLGGAGYLIWGTGSHKAPVAKDQPSVTRTVTAKDIPATPIPAASNGMAATSAPTSGIASSSPVSVSARSQTAVSARASSGPARPPRTVDKPHRPTNDNIAIPGTVGQRLANEPSAVPGKQGRYSITDPSRTPDKTTNNGRIKEAFTDFALPGSDPSNHPSDNVLPPSRDREVADPTLAWLYVPRASTSGGVSLHMDVHGESRPDPIKSTAKRVTTRVQNRHSLYVGLIGAPDFSTVRFQSVKAVGTTYGFLVGYTLNARWSLESGVYVDRKKYYTEGQYFNKDKVPPLRYVELKNLDGKCNMIEVPVNVRYNLTSGDKMKWFATTGLSTYFMSSEWYDYRYLSYGNLINKAATYRNPSQNWFSIVNLSVGYETRLGRVGSLRLEPYVRVPLSGIGTGSLPIMSAGLNIGITRRIW